MRLYASVYGRFKLKIFSKEIIKLFIKLNILVKSHPRIYHIEELLRMM